MTRRVRALPILLLAGLTPLLRGECPYPTETPSMERAIPAVSSIRLHEWGVWRIGADGRVVSAHELASESPTFVHRSTEVPGVEIGSPGLAVPCEKPVIYLHSEVAMDVTISVGFTRGAPWLHFPGATEGRTAGTPTLQWYGHVLPEAEPTHGLVEVPSTHWWARLRAPRSSVFVTERGERERFVFYDGDTLVAPFYRMGRRALEVVPGRHPPAHAWTLDAGRAARLEPQGRRVRSVAIGATVELRASVRASLVASGLAADEAESLLATWNASLFEGDSRRIVWIMRADDYEAMLPLRVWPIPRETVRVGLVIQGY